MLCILASAAALKTVLACPCNCGNILRLFECFFPLGKEKPSSLTTIAWVEESTDKDSSTVCVKYRSRRDGEFVLSTSRTCAAVAVCLGFSTSTDAKNSNMCLTALDDKVFCEYYAERLRRVMQIADMGIVINRQ